MSRRKAVIVGHAGQDGRLLTELLQTRGYDIVGIGRDSNTSSLPTDDLHGVPVENPDEVDRLVRSVRPSEVYFLAAHHRSSEDPGHFDIREDTVRSFRTNVVGPLNFVEAIRLHSPRTRFFYASSSLIFGPDGGSRPQDESTPVSPIGNYAMTKALAGQHIKAYRETHRLFCCVGILYNHESIYRRPSFLTRRVILEALNIKAGRQEALTVGRLDCVVDWGYAPDFVDAMVRILSHDEPEDFVVATGEGHTVRELVSLVFEHLGLDWRNHVRESREVLRRRLSGRIGQPAKLRRLTGWKPTVNFREMVRLLVDGTAAQQARECETAREA